MRNYIELVYEDIEIKEGIEAVEQVLQTIYFYGPLGNKEISERTQLPIPLITAIRNEFVARGIVRRRSGSEITDKGRDYIEGQLGFANLNKELYFRLLKDPWGDHPEITKVIDQLGEIFENRPKVDVTLDQSKATIDTSVRRGILALIKGSLIGKKILCLGDDDLVSISICFLLKQLFSSGYGQTTIKVLDIDRRILDYIHETGKTHGFPIITKEQNLREPLGQEDQGECDALFTDPPYTLEGITLFLSRGVQGLKPVSGLSIFASYAHKYPEHILKLQRQISAMGLVIKEILPAFNFYQGASILGSQSQMMVLETTRETSADLETAYKGALYTGEKNQTIRQYECRKCGNKTSVGIGEKIKTVEELKSKGCSNCLSTTFDLTHRRQNKGKHYEKS